MNKKLFEDYSVKEIKKEILYWETNGGQDPKKVDVVSIGQDPKSDIYFVEDEQENDETYEDFFATLMIDGVMHIKKYTLAIGTGSIDSACERVGGCYDISDLISLDTESKKFMNKKDIVNLLDNGRIRFDYDDLSDYFDFERVFVDTNKMLKQKYNKGICEAGMIICNSLSINYTEIEVDGLFADNINKYYFIHKIYDMLKDYSSISIEYDPSCNNLYIETK